MKIVTLLTILTLAPILVYSQTETDAWIEKSAKSHNGAQDQDEFGVDCYKVSQPGYNKCNGLLDIILNGQPYKISLNDVVSTPLGTNNRASIFILTANTYTDGTMQSGFALTFTLFCNPLKEDEYILKKDPQAVLGAAGIKHGIMTMSIDFKHKGFPIEIKKIKHGNLKIEAMDKINRVMSGSIDIDALTVDMTPIVLKGSFSNITY